MHEQVRKVPSARAPAEERPIPRLHCPDRSHRNGRAVHRREILRPDGRSGRRQRRRRHRGSQGPARPPQQVGLFQALGHRAHQRVDALCAGPELQICGRGRRGLPAPRRRRHQPARQSRRRDGRPADPRAGRDGRRMRAQRPAVAGHDVSARSRREGSSAWPRPSSTPRRWRPTSAPTS